MTFHFFWFQKSFRDFDLWYFRKGVSYNVLQLPEGGDFEEIHC
jgi:hypothetical protein